MSVQKLKESQIKQVLNTCPMLYGNPMPVQRPNAFNDQRHRTTYLSFWIDSYDGSQVEHLQSSRTCVICRFIAWMHEQIKEMPNTFLIADGSLLPFHKLNAITHPRHAKYITRFGWKSYVGSKVECINISMKCSMHLSCWIEVQCQFNGWTFL
jgi:hypothetical protein